MWTKLSSRFPTLGLCLCVGNNSCDCRPIREASYIIDGLGGVVVEHLELLELNFQDFGVDHLVERRISVAMAPCTFSLRSR